MGDVMDIPEPEGKHRIRFGDFRIYNENKKVDRLINEQARDDPERRVPRVMDGVALQHLDEITDAKQEQGDHFRNVQVPAEVMEIFQENDIQYHENNIYDREPCPGFR